MAHTDSTSANGPVGPRDIGVLQDPLVRALTVSLLAVIAFFLIAVVSAVLFGFLRPAQAPRTLAERDLAMLGAEVEAGSADAETWGGYVATLIDTGQLEKAREALRTALESVTSGRSFILLQQARLEFASGDYAQCAGTANATRLAAEEELNAKLAELAARGIKSKASLERPSSWLEAVHLEGDALARMEDYTGALAAYDEYLKVMPTAADMFVTRGLTKMKIGDNPGAEKDFREALRFIPDYAPAIEGLEQIGAVSE